MPHSLRAKLSGLRYKGIITDKDYQRLRRSLDIEKGVQDAIAEIEEQRKSIHISVFEYNGLLLALDIIRKHTGDE